VAQAFVTRRTLKGHSKQVQPQQQGHGLQQQRCEIFSLTWSSCSSSKTSSSCICLCLHLWSEDVASLLVHCNILFLMVCSWFFDCTWRSFYGHFTPTSVKEGYLIVVCPSAAQSDHLLRCLCLCSEASPCPWLSSLCLHHLGDLLSICYWTELGGPSFAFFC